MGLPAVGLGVREAGPAGTETAQDISLEHGARVHPPGLERKFAKPVSTQNQPPHLRGVKEETGGSVTEEKCSEKWKVRGGVAYSESSISRTALGGGFKAKSRESSLTDSKPRALAVCEQSLRGSP